MQITNKNVNNCLWACFIIAIFIISVLFFIVYYEKKLTTIESKYIESREGYFSLIYAVRNSTHTLKGYYSSEVDIESFIKLLESTIKIVEDLNNIVQSYSEKDPNIFEKESANLLSIRVLLSQHNDLIFTLAEKIDEVSKISTAKKRKEVEKEFIYKLVNEGDLFRLRQELFLNIITSFQSVTEHFNVKIKEFNKTIEYLLYLVASSLILLLAFGSYLIFSIRKNILLPIYHASKYLSNDSDIIKVFPLIETDSPECYALFSTLNKYSHQANVLLNDSRYQVVKINKMKDDAELLANNQQAFLSTMSHEIRTPLNSIIGGIQFMYKEFSHSKEIVESLNDMSEASNLLSSVINEILDFSKLESSQVYPDYSYCSTSAFVSTVSSIIRNLQKENKNIQIWISRRTPMLLNIDRKKLTQVFINLINNSLIHANSKVIRVKIDYSTEKKELILKIIDFGIGIPTDALATMFDPYRSSSLHSQSTGLGLAISKKIVECMGGKINVRSTVSRGTCFTITLPCPYSSDPDEFFGDYVASSDVGVIANLDTPLSYLRYHFDKFTRSQSVNSIRSNGVTEPFAFMSQPNNLPTEQRSKQDAFPSLLQQFSFLVAEDFSLNRRLLSKLAKRDNLNFVFAADGQQAIEKARSSRFDLILMDIQMPVMDGFEATRAIRALDGYSATPIIGLSAHVEEDITNMCKESGMNELVHKPFDIDDLKQRLEYWLTRA